MFGFDQDMIFRIPALLIALTVHEYAHARAAVWLGDPTPRFEGRLTLNPIAHLDPLGLIMLWLFKFGWAKPVNVNPANFKDWRKGMIMVSFAGPASNIIMAVIAAIVITLLAKLHILTGWVAAILQLTYTYNVILAIFNLIPIPPLDGSKIVASLLPGRIAYQYESIGRYGPFILIGLIYLGVIGAIMYPLQFILSVMINTIVNVIF
ncbi:site-2 protease family protein|uniref:Zn-dependent protease (Includes SpoIVFB) n=1 Tax=Dendrosporobacter quercicolus TaxID=146817 RepID=A0A1G9L264_9FIRM|nr:site-2 protease family protein [Dendrosporobacter quercicolus]NSL46568.1 site-2 protease family protein [Dendrosporobacter quercicolus DSM 1736]SDL56039.1 Zn-dependent protease (includes SpoIVFB) [Dendrosporobacter quercicolus]